MLVGTFKRGLGQAVRAGLRPPVAARSTLEKAAAASFSTRDGPPPQTNSALGSKQAGRASLFPYLFFTFPSQSGSPAAPQLNFSLRNDGAALLPARALRSAIANTLPRQDGALQPPGSSRSSSWCRRAARGSSSSRERHALLSEMRIFLSCVTFRVRRSSFSLSLFHVSPFPSPRFSFPSFLPSCTRTFFASSLAVAFACHQLTPARASARPRRFPQPRNLPRRSNARGRSSSPSVANCSG